MRSSMLLGFGLSFALLPSCGGESAVPDAGLGTDGGAYDAGTMDAGARDAQAPQRDAGGDGATSLDTGLGVDAGTSEGGAVDAEAHDGGADDASLGDAGPSLCAAQTAAIGGELYTSPRACSIVVRLDYGSYAILGWQLVCGGYAATDETAARAHAQADTGFGEGALLATEASPADAWVFWLPAADFGGASAVAAHTGLTVFGGGIVWGGRGDITYPHAWRSPADLATDCVPSAGDVPRTRGWNLSGGMALPAADVDAAIAVVRRTPLLAALWSGGYVFDAVVLRYPRSVGTTTTDGTEWIVVLDGGWLE